jgi:flagellar hook-length control protein FliK
MNAAQQALPSKRSTSLRPTSDIMDAGITTAATATGPAPGAQPAGLFGALAGAKGHGPMSGFQALLAAFFGHQGEDAGIGLLGGDPAALKGKAAALALKSDSKAGHMTMDDALNPAPDPGAHADEKTADLAATDPAATATGLSPDAQALAALFAAPLQKAPPVDETSAKPPAAQAAAAVKDAAVPAVALGAADTPPVDLAAADGAQDAKTGAETGQAAVANGRSKLAEFAEALAATRHGARAAALKTDAATQPGYRPPPAAVAAEAATKPAPAPTPDIPETAAASPAVEAEVAGAELPAPVPALAKDRGGVRANRIETARKETAAQPLLTPTAIDPATKPVATVVTAAFATQPAHADSVDDKPAEPEVAPLKVEATDDAGLAQAPAAAAHATPASAQAATTAARGAPETVASLAAHIIKSAQGRATRFDVELHPADLGRVDVRLEIGAHGRMTASMSFENPQAAAELRGRADELRNALENAGFDVSGGLSFDVAGDPGQGRNRPDQQAPDGGGVLRGRAFEAAVAAAGETANVALAGALSAYQSRVAPGLDIRI